MAGQDYTYGFPMGGFSMPHNIPWDSYPIIMDKGPMLDEWLNDLMSIEGMYNSENLLPLLCSFPSPGSCYLSKCLSSVENTLTE